jgi:uncharacterized protein YndB with AHSA1/START domain
VTSPPGLEPINIAFDVDCDADHAFNLWTARTSLWWPPSHTVSGKAGLDVVFEPRVGGRIFERTAEGVEHDWGEILEWEPPRRLVYLWHLKVDRADATEVEIRFIAQEGGTQVQIEHRGWDRLGAPAIPRREGNLAGWGSLLPHYQEAAAEA